MKVMMHGIHLNRIIRSFRHFVVRFPGGGVREGSILEVTYISPEGEKLTTNIKVQASDLELLRELSGGN